MKLSVLANLYGKKTLEETLQILTGLGVHTVEEFDPDPFLEALDQYGLPRRESHDPVLVD